jgi:hypothetical protein
MKKNYAIIAVFLSLTTGIFAQENLWVIRNVSGKVEIKDAGSQVWVPAQGGETLRRDTVISTGFRSVAVLSLGDSVLMVRPLTRLSLEELTRLPGKDDVKLNLQTGRIRVRVNPPAAGGVGFTVRSAIATASVRGTAFDFDTFNLEVHQGTVNFSTPNGPARLVRAGTSSSFNEATRTATPPVEETTLALASEPPAGVTAGLPIAGSGISAAAPGSGSNSGPAPGPGESPPPADDGFTVDLTW